MLTDQPAARWRPGANLHVASTSLDELRRTIEARQRRRARVGTAVSQSIGSPMPASARELHLEAGVHVEAMAPVFRLEHGAPPRGARPHPRFGALPRNIRARRGPAVDRACFLTCRGHVSEAHANVSLTQVLRDDVVLCED